jgi:DNA-binding GntR family transcriptional regulator
MRVARQAPDSVHELLIPLRRTIESYAVRLSFANLDEEFFRGWEEILERMHDACQRCCARRSDRLTACGRRP